MNGPELSLVIPLYNEEANLPAVPDAIAAALVAAGIDYELVLVDNGSRDGTAAILDEMASRDPRIRIVTISENDGFGWGVTCGLAVCQGYAVGYMGGDGQNRPEDVVSVYQLLRRRHLHLAKVRRVTRGDGWQRRVITRLCNAIFPLLFPVRSRDINGTPKIMRGDVYRALRPRSRDWFIDAEIMIKLGARGGTCGEVDVDFLPRAGGSSNVRWTTLAEFLINIVRFTFEPWRWRPQSDEAALPRNGRSAAAVMPEGSS